MNDEATATKEHTAGSEEEVPRELIKVEETIEKIVDAANVDRVYGKPIEKGDTVIIPAAEIVAGMGLGGGSGSGRKTPAGGQDVETEEGSGGGGGGGGHTRSRPVAVVVAANGSVRVDPVLDKTKIILTALIAEGILALLLLRMFRKS